MKRNVSGPPTLEKLAEKLAKTEALLAHRDDEMAELQHRITNSLTLVSSFLHLQSGRLTDEAAKSALADATARIDAVARLYRSMRQQSSAARIDFGQYLTSLGTDMSVSTGLRCIVQTEPIILDSNTAMTLAVATNELVLNASKHAYQAKGGVVDVTCRLVDGEEVLLSVADHGRGLPLGFDPQQTRGLGLSYVGRVVQILGGRLETETSNQGARFTIMMPLSRLVDP